MIVLLFLLVTSAHASQTKWFIVPDATDPSKQVIVGAGGFAPSNAIAEAPVDPEGKPYPIEAIDIVDEPICETCEEAHRVAKVNQAKLDAKKAKDAKDADDADKAKRAKDKARSDRLERIRIGCTIERDPLKKDMCEHILDQ